MSQLDKYTAWKTDLLIHGCQNWENCWEGHLFKRWVSSFIQSGLNWARISFTVKRWAIQSVAKPTSLSWFIKVRCNNVDILAQLTFVEILFGFFMWLNRNFIRHSIAIEYSNICSTVAYVLVLLLLLTGYHGQNCDTDYKWLSVTAMIRNKGFLLITEFKFEMSIIKVIFRFRSWHIK